MNIYKTIIFIKKYIFKLVRIPIPKTLIGQGKILEVSSILKDKEVAKTLIVTDKNIMKLGLLDDMLKTLDNDNIEYIIYDDVNPNPTIKNVHDGVNVYNNNNLESIIAFGGGSPIDCAKGIAASVIKKKPIDKLKGLMKVGKKLMPFIVVPTTAGTGSETTVVAVITDEDKKQKFTVIDPKLCPQYAVLDPNVTLGLPKHITAHTGMDALTHAVESLIGRHNSKFTRKYSLDAIKDIIEYLPIVYNDPNNVEAREKMLVASYNAGIAFTRANIGYVHAIAHQLGGLYHTPHGYANAVILPHILDYSYEGIIEELALASSYAGIGNNNDSKEELASKFINTVKKMNNDFKIPSIFTELKTEDIPIISKRTLKEAHGNYPVPKYLNHNKSETLLNKLISVN